MQLFEQQEEAKRKLSKELGVKCGLAKFSSHTDWLAYIPRDRKVGVSLADGQPYVYYDMLCSFRAPTIEEACAGLRVKFNENV